MITLAISINIASKSTTLIYIISICPDNHHDISLKLVVIFLLTGVGSLSLYRSNQKALDKILMTV